MVTLVVILSCYVVAGGWGWGVRKAGKEIEAGGSRGFPLKRPWEVIVKFIAPAVILVILYFTVGKGQGLS